ncbi:gliding motility-associated C-terminal domain-containing protein [Crocinitomicaceae bacterium]|nr:gliding motility-associated C-terminal domain-containing protein [Crocinitomicaceae bacterium]MDB3906229.1 gliding motility-associated C-terminal domain-containing protein [Crocinitomicaceae bacterium]
MKSLILFLFAVLTFSGNAQDCPELCAIYVPNVLTPDCEGDNCELLIVRSECSFLAYEIKVFNRWGMVLFESDDPEVHFDSSEVEEGSFVWMVEVTYCNMEKANYNGNVTVVK